MPHKDLTITIKIVNGRPEPFPSNIDGGHALGHKKYKVTWTGDGDTVAGPWAVGICWTEATPPDSPFKNGELVVASYGDEAVTVRANKVGTFDYWIWCLDTDGTQRFHDPKLIIRDMGRFSIDELVELYADGLEELAETANANVEILRGLSDVSRSFSDQESQETPGQGEGD